MSKLLLSALFSVGLLLIGICIFLVTVPPCALSQFNIFDKSCVGQQKLIKSDATNRILALERRLETLKTELSSINCAYNNFNTQSGTQQNQILSTEEVFDFNQRELDGLAGCWELVGSRQTFYLVDCISDCEEFPSSNAVYCFNEDGSGNVETELSGAYCRGDIVANFNSEDAADTLLIFNEPDGQKCDPGLAASFIVPREYQCRLTEDFRISCDTSNSRGNSSNIVLRRIENGD